MPNNTGKKDFYLKSLIMQSDTIITDSTRVDTNIVQKDTIESTRDTTQPIQEIQSKLDISKIDSLLRANEAKEREFKKQKAVKPVPEKKTIDTTAELHELFGVTKMPISERLQDDPSTLNFLYNIPAYTKQDTPAKIYKEQNNSEQKVEKTIQQIQRKELQEDHTDWTIYLIAGILLIVGWARLFYKKYSDMLLKSIVYLNYAQNLFQEKNSLTTRASMLLNFSYFLTLGMFSFQIKEHFNIEFLPTVFPAYKVFMFSMFFVAWYVWNAIFTKFVGSVFQRQQPFGEYFHNTNIHRKLQGMAIFPIIVIIQFISVDIKEPFLYAGIILFAVIYLLHIIRGLQIFRKNNVSIFYLILYLCALEFLPLFVLFEGIIRNT